MSQTKANRSALLGAIAVALCTALAIPRAGFCDDQGLPDKPQLRGDIFRDPVSGKLKLVPPETEIHVCAEAQQDPACETDSLQSALNRIAPDGTVVLHAGVYREAAYVRRHGTHLRARAGAHLVGTAVGGKGALVVAANDVVIEGLACSGIAVRDRNGACVRLEGRNLTLRGVHFFDSEEGLLAGKNSGRVVIEDSRFENLGRAGRAHGIYVNGGELIVRRSVFLASKDEGHEIKSRASRTIIEDNVIASLDGLDSYLIDISNGGEAIIRRNLLQEGPASANRSSISFAMEGDRYKDSRIAIEENVIVLARRNTLFVLAKTLKAAFARNVVILGRNSYSLGAVDAACGQAGNICINPSKAKDRTLPLPRIEDLDRILAETGLLR